MSLNFKDIKTYAALCYLLQEVGILSKSAMATDVTQVVAEYTDYVMNNMERISFEDAEKWRDYLKLDPFKTHFRLKCNVYVGMMSVAFQKRSFSVLSMEEWTRWLFRLGEILAPREKTDFSLQAVSLMSFLASPTISSASAAAGFEIIHANTFPKEPFGLGGWDVYATAYKLKDMRFKDGRSSWSLESFRHAFIDCLVYALGETHKLEFRDESIKRCCCELCDLVLEQPEEFAKWVDCVREFQQCNVKILNPQ